jgi:hypothetical protein
MSLVREILERGRQEKLLARRGKRGLYLIH